MNMLMVYTMPKVHTILKFYTKLMVYTILMINTTMIYNILMVDIMSMVVVKLKQDENNIKKKKRKNPKIMNIHKLNSMQDFTVKGVGH